MTRIVLSGLVALFGAALAVGGIRLISLGGTWGYLILGLLLLLSAGLLLARRKAGLAVYGAAVVVALAWGVWAVGLDWWALAPQRGVLVLLGLFLLLPPVARGLRRGAGGFRGHGREGMVLAASVAGAVVVAGLSLFTHPPDTGGHFADARMGADLLSAPRVPDGDRAAYGRTAAGQRYSPLAQITPANVKDLEVAWEYHAGDVHVDLPGLALESTPLIVGDTLYLCTSRSELIALDPVTGKERWRSAPALAGLTPALSTYATCRGLTYHDATGLGWEVSDEAPRDERRAAEPVRASMGLATTRAAGVSQNIVAGIAGPGDPNTGNVLVVGGSVNDTLSDSLPSGAIRAFHICTGRLAWNFDPGNPDMTTPIQPGETFTRNVPDNWSVGSHDPDLNLVDLPMGIGSPDHYGGNRTPEDERFGTSIIALGAATGALRRVHQTVHHDIWHCDVPAQPSLTDLTVNGEIVPALVQPTRQGGIFVLDRRTGGPLLSVREVPVSRNAVPGEKPGPTQPVSAVSFKAPPVTGAQMWGLSPVDPMMCRIGFARLTYEGRFTPPGLNGAVTHPGSFGVFNWGGVAVDPARQLACAMPVYLAFTSTLIPRPGTLEEIVSAPGYPMGNENFGTPYAAVLKPFMSPLGLPCQQPPWGYVAGIDLTTGDTVYQHVNGTVRDMAPVPLPFKTGVPGIGGPIVTGGGLAFLSVTVDYYMRGYDLANGDEIWRARLPAGGRSTPVTCMGRDGRQYLVVVAGGHGYVGTKLGDAVIAHALPEG